MVLELTGDLSQKQMPTQTLPPADFFCFPHLLLRIIVYNFMTTFTTGISERLKRIDFFFFTIKQAANFHQAEAKRLNILPTMDKF